MRACVHVLAVGGTAQLEDELPPRAGQLQGDSAHSSLSAMAVEMMTREGVTDANIRCTK